MSSLSIIIFTVVWIFFAGLGVASESTIQCSIVDKRPTTKQCLFQLKIDSSTKTFTEEFVLSLNDPVEYFHYLSRYAPFAEQETPRSEVFFRLPVLGHIRDQFVDSDPFNDTLLFTFSAGGIGYFWDLGGLQIILDSNIIYIKQRYAPPLLHSTEDSDPTNNSIYQFAQFGSLSRVELFSEPISSLSLRGVYEHKLMRAQSRLLDYRETYALMKWRILEADGFGWGASASYYYRTSEFRRDRQTDKLERARFGIFVELM